MNKSLLLSLLALGVFGVCAWWLTQRPGQPSPTELDKLIAQSNGDPSTDQNPTDSNSQSASKSKASSSDPRLTYPTIFRNIKPDVAYVG
ncbi:MAG: hypothetical protein ACK6AO_10645, partial [Planctomycetota bacterium]